MSSPTGRQAAKAIRFLEAYGCGDIKIGQAIGSYPNPSVLKIDYSDLEARVIATDVTAEFHERPACDCGHCKWVREGRAYERDRETKS